MFVIAFVVFGFAALFWLFNPWRLSKTQTTYPVQGEIVEAIYGLGTVMASEVYDLKLGVPCRIEEVYVKEGESVRKDQILISVKSPDLKNLTAPFGGIVTAVSFKSHEIALAGQLIVSLMNLDHLYVQVALQQDEAVRVSPGQRATFSFQGLPNENFEGRVSAIYPHDGNFFVRVDAPDLPPSIFPGMNTDVSIELARKEQALLVPKAAVNDGKVLILKKRKKREVAVKTGLSDNEMIEITSQNLSLNDKVILR